MDASRIFMPLFRPWNVERSSAIGRRLSLTIGVLALGGLPSVVGAAACTVRDLPLLGTCVYESGAGLSGKADGSSCDQDNSSSCQPRSGHGTPAERPESPEYRARYLDSAEGLNQLIIDTIAMDDCCVHASDPEGGARQRRSPPQDVLKLHIDPLRRAFDQSALDIVKQSTQWDPDGLKEAHLFQLASRSRDFSLATAAHRALDAEDDVSGVAKELDKSVANYAELVSMLLAAGAIRSSPLEDWQEMRSSILLKFRPRRR